jgi:hypothetical protein
VAFKKFWAKITVSNGKWGMEHEKAKFVRTDTLLVAFVAREKSTSVRLLPHRKTILPRSAFAQQGQSRIETIRKH